MIDNDKLEFAKLIVQIYSKYGSMIYQPAVRETYSKALKVIDDSLESNYHETK